jgi:hypothetical protein
MMGENSCGSGVLMIDSTEMQWRCEYCRDGCGDPRGKNQRV